MKRVHLILFTLVIACFLGSDLFAGSPPKTVIKLATLAPRGSEIMKILDEMDAEIQKQTGNEVGFKVYYGGVQGDENDVLRKILMGQLHGGAFTGNGLGKIVPEVRVTEVPYLFWNDQEVAYVRGHLRGDMESLFRKQGYIVLGWNEVGFIYNFSKVPISSIEVARQQKWWMWEGDPLSQAVFDAFGITPVPLSFTEVMTSLSTKLVDTASITPYGAVAFRWSTRFTYMDEYPVTNVVGATVVTMKAWNKIPEKHQKIILDLSPNYFGRMNGLNRNQNKQSIEVLKKSGIKIVPFNPNSKGFVFKAAETARENLVGKLYSRELLDRTLALLSEFRKTHPELGVEKLQ